MTAQTTVHLLRHGEVHNPAKILYGRLPGYRLSDDGVAMAKRAADWFTEMDVVHIVASPLERAQQTAQPLAEAKGLEVVVDERIIEAGNAFEGLAVGVGDGVLRAPRHWWKLRNPVRPSWGEPYVEIAARMLAAVEAARDAARAARHRHPLERVAGLDQPVVDRHGQRQCLGDRRRRLLGALERAGDQVRDVAPGEPGGRLLRHPETGVRQPEPRQPAVEHLGGVVHLAVAEQVHDGLLAHAAASAAARAAAGSAERTRSSASPVSAALTNHDSNADGGRYTPRASSAWKKAV